MSATSVADDGSRPGPSMLVVFAGLMLVMLMASLDQAIVATALPTIVGDLGGLNQLSWVVTAYLLTQAVVPPLYRKLGDMVGRKVVLQVALVIFLIGSALCGLAQNMTMLILFRGLQGLGGGGLMVSTMAAIGTASLERLVDGWSPDQHPDLAVLLTRMARELQRDAPTEAAEPALA
jgi:MFS family permease